MALIAEINARHLLPKKFGPKSKFNERLERKYLNDFLSGRGRQLGLVATNEEFQNLTFSAWYFLSKVKPSPAKPFDYHFTFNKESVRALSFLFGNKSTGVILRFFEPKIKGFAKSDDTGIMHTSMLEFGDLWEELAACDANISSGGLVFERDKKMLIYRTADIPLDKTTIDYLKQIQVLYQHSLSIQEAVIPLFNQGSYGEQRVPYTFRTAIPWIVDLSSLKEAAKRHQTRFRKLAQEIL